MSNPPNPEPDLVVLHTLRCAGAASTERLSTMLEARLDVDVEGCVLDLAARGFLTHGGGGFGGWRLTEAGRAADADAVADELERTGARPEVQASFEQFLTLNRRTLDICGDWQVRRYEQPMVLNDHKDPMYDAGVLKRLAAVNAQVQPICERLTASLPRFSHYGQRLTTALERAQSGEIDQVADTLDSYHAVWFQLHEDLLATLGIPRQA